MKTKLLFILLFFISISCFAQKRTITGIVYDENKNVLADANVIVKNSEKGTITNDKGQFTMDVEGVTVLEISYLGFETKEVTVTNLKKVSVILNTSSELMDAMEIIVPERKIECTKIACTKFSIRRACGVTSEGVSIEKNVPNEKSMIRLFPNPSANGMFQLQLNESYTKVTTEVYTMNGQLLQSNTYTKLSKNPQIDLSKQAKGIYLIRIVADGNVLKTKKAIRS
ncbi:carboxypeptidase-like regulatory domain-containing protein [uncultured Kordia sp.]|uniref:carboxypeptidase-like regulatory domain-containing protein n=1 Tax=uncultured Kordia sp. TaxID=507699 RepID=UPI002623720C|nr:carboxypeptidase-like regulatory domain-containing protein [uncultured Kordia sp.]